MLVVPRLKATYNSFARFEACKRSEYIDVVDFQSLLSLMSPWNESNQHFLGFLSGYGLCEDVSDPEMASSSDPMQCYKGRFCQRFSGFLAHDRVPLFSHLMGF